MSVFDLKGNHLSLIFTAVLLVGCETVNEETYRAIPFNTTNVTVGKVAAAMKGKYSQEAVADCFYVSNTAVSSALNSDANYDAWQGGAESASSFALKEFKLKQAQFSKSSWEKIYLSQAKSGVTKVPTGKSAMRNVGSEIIDSLLFRDPYKVEAGKIDACISPVLDTIDLLATAKSSLKP